MDEHALWGIVGIVLLAAVALSTTFELYIRALRLLVYQFKVNRTAISWVALVLILIPTIIVVGGIILIVVSSLNK